MSVLAVDIGGTNYRVAVVDASGQILQQQRYAVVREAGAESLLRQLLPQVLEAAASAGEPPAAVGVGFGGPVDFYQQRVMRSMHVSGWKDFSFADWLRPYLGLPVIVDNDGNAGAWGEYLFGAGRGSTDMVYYTVSTGVGGGIVLDGRLRRGRHSQAAELGHVPLLAAGPTCSCGAQGCVESLCSGPALAQRAIDYVRNDDSRDSSLAALYRQKDTLTAQDVFIAAQSGDTTATGLLQTTRMWFVRAVRGVVATLDVDTVVVGGGVGTAAGFLDGVEQSVNQQRLLPEVAPVSVVPAALADDSVLLGAAGMALETC